jgi:aerobic-type carbon monoxide dehydrogenase small subunit (CoxS/CutS family)
MTAFTVNDRPVRYRMDPATPLLFALREGSNLTGTKNGCGTGECGTCTVDIDGEAIRSCQISIADCEGRFVTTIEALSPDRSHPVQQAWALEQVTQCGFCDPGFIMAIAVLLKKNPSPSEADIGCNRACGSPLPAHSASFAVRNAPPPRRRPAFVPPMPRGTCPHSARAINHIVDCDLR